MHQLLAHSVTE